MKLSDFLNCVHDIDMNTSMTRMYCTKCLQDANVIKHIEQITERIISAEDTLMLFSFSLNTVDAMPSSLSFMRQRVDRYMKKYPIEFSDHLETLSGSK